MSGLSPIIYLEMAQTSLQLSTKFRCFLSLRSNVSTPRPAALFLILSTSPSGGVPQAKTTLCPLNFSIQQRLRACSAGPVHFQLLKRCSMNIGILFYRFHKHRDSFTAFLHDLAQEFGSGTYIICVPGISLEKAHPVRPCYAPRYGRVQLGKVFYPSSERNFMVKDYLVVIYKIKLPVTIRELFYKYVARLQVTVIDFSIVKRPHGLGKASYKVLFRLPSRSTDRFLEVFQYVMVHAGKTLQSGTEQKCLIRSFHKGKGSDVRIFRTTRPFPITHAL